jgi:hypothetical protein
MPKVQQGSGNQHFLTIPLDIVRGKGWKKGTEVSVSIYPNGDVVLKEI